MLSMAKVNDCAKWFSLFDIACDEYQTCNDVIYILVPLEPVTRVQIPAAALKLYSNSMVSLLMSNCKDIEHLYL
jgi:hypothetical protein